MTRNSSTDLNIEEDCRSNSSATSVACKEAVRENPAAIRSVNGSTNGSGSGGLLHKIGAGFRALFRRRLRTRTTFSDTEIQILRAITGYSQEEIVQWHEQYIQDYPDGLITRKRFLSMYTSLVPTSDAKCLAKHIFRAFDLDKSDAIDFHEFLVGLYMTSATSSIRNKLEWTFNILDIDGNGWLTRHETAEVLGLFTRFYVSLRGDPQVSSVEDVVAKARDSMMKIFDNASADQLTRAQFVEGCLQSPLVCQLLTAAANARDITSQEPTHSPTDL